MEYFDVVNEEDKIIGKASRDKVHEKKLIHRAVTVFVFNSKGELFMGQRSKNKKLNPLKWQASPSGHVKSGEDYEQTSERELFEETGIKDKPKFKFDIKVYSDEQKENFRLYTLYNDSAKMNNEEFEQVRYMTLEEINKMIKENSSQFRDAFLLMFERYSKTK